MPEDEYPGRLLKREIEWLDRHIEAKFAASEKATTVAMDTLNERLKGWPEKMDNIEKKVAGFEGKALVAGGIAGFIMSILAGVILLKIFGQG